MGHTNVGTSLAVRNAVKQTDQTACIFDGLLVPNDRLAIARAVVLGLRRIFLPSELLVRFANGEDEEEGESWAGNEGEKLWFIDAEDVMEGKLLGETKLVNEGVHHLRVVLYWRVSCLEGATVLIECGIPRGTKLFFPVGTSGLSRLCCSVDAIMETV